MKTPSLPGRACGDTPCAGWAAGRWLPSARRRWAAEGTLSSAPLLKTSAAVSRSEPRLTDCGLFSEVTMKAERPRSDGGTQSPLGATLWYLKDASASAGSEERRSRCACGCFTGSCSDLQSWRPPTAPGACGVERRNPRDDDAPAEVLEPAAANPCPRGLLPWGARSWRPVKSPLPLLRNRRASALSAAGCAVIFLILPIFNFSPRSKMLLPKKKKKKFLSAGRKEQCLAQSLGSAVRSLQLQYTHTQKKKKAPKHQEQKQSKNLLPVSLRFFLAVIFLTRRRSITGKETSK